MKLDRELGDRGMVGLLMVEEVVDIVVLGIVGDTNSHWHI
jgi:hypothetical protein